MIRKFVVYLLSCNISEIMVVFLASVVNAPLPILPLQILFLNLVTDVFPALALGVGEGFSLVPMLVGQVVKAVRAAEIGLSECD